ncbi:hypothetical protein KIW84_061271 [Lathyrus oleraceus]|uniref:Uncharacterized protein n=1 Tax=Pisum sativum TaxID=3888 RepID=A0A9D4W1Z8_PEA|nr:hypothetical protein KIW84_061271 [Pisum sativum]
MTSTNRAIMPKKKAKKIVICWEISQERKNWSRFRRQVESRMVALLKEYVGTLTWSCQDMPGSDTDVVGYKLPRRENSPLEKQNASAYIREPW